MMGMNLYFAKNCIITPSKPAPLTSCIHINASVLDQPTLMSFKSCWISTPEIWLTWAVQGTASLQSHHQVSGDLFALQLAALLLLLWIDMSILSVLISNMSMLSSTPTMLTSMIMTTQDWAWTQPLHSLTILTIQVCNQMWFNRQMLTSSRMGRAVRWTMWHCQYHILEGLKWWIWPTKTKMNNQCCMTLILPMMTPSIHNACRHSQINWHMAISMQYIPPSQDWQWCIYGTHSQNKVRHWVNLWQTKRIGWQDITPHHCWWKWHVIGSVDIGCSLHHVPIQF